MKKRFGFSLLELMVVIGIIAILAALLFPAYRNMLEKGRNIQCKSNLRSLWRGAMSYSADLPEVVLKANQSASGAIVGQYAELPPRLPQVWVYPNPFVPNNTDISTLSAPLSGWRGQAGLNALTNEIAYCTAINYEFVKFPTLFRYVDRNIEVYACPSFKKYMKLAYPGNTNTIYRSYVINQRICGSVASATNLADLAKLSTKTQAVQFVLFTEALMPNGSDYGPSSFSSPMAMTSRYHNAQHKSGMQFTNGTINAIYLDGHIEAVTNRLTF